MLLTETGKGATKVIASLIIDDYCCHLAYFREANCFLLHKQLNTNHKRTVISFEMDSHCSALVRHAELLIFCLPGTLHITFLILMTYFCAFSLKTILFFFYFLGAPFYVIIHINIFCYCSNVSLDLFFLFACLTFCCIFPACSVSGGLVFVPAGSLQ